VAGDPVKIEGGTAVQCNVPVAEAINDEGVLPERVRQALGQLIGAAREGLLAWSVEVGLGVLRELLEAEVDQLVGPKGKWDPDRTAVRHGHEDGEVTLGGRRVGVERPRVRTVDGESEVPLGTYEHFADRDQLGDVGLERMLAGVSTRKYRRAQEPVGNEIEDDARSTSTSKSAVSRTFVDRTREQLRRLMNRPLAGAAPGGDDARRDRICTATRTSSLWGSPPRATSSRWGGGTGRARTPRSPARCSPTWLTAA
jgi:hypothetical protein